MTDFLNAYSIQTWLESCPQGYLEETEYGHRANEREPEVLIENEVLREEAIRTTVQLVVGERAALAASSGLVNAAPDHPSKRFLATQTLDEARHVEVFTQRLFDLGVKKNDLESTIKQFANPHLVKFAEVLLEKVDAKDFIAGVVGQNIVLEGLAFSTFEMLHASSAEMNPKFAHTLSGTIADERRHVGFGENRIGSLIKENPDRKPEIQKMQKEMSYHMLATFADAFRGQTDAIEEARRLEQATAQAGGAPAKSQVWHGTDLQTADPAEMEAVLSDTVLKEFKIRLGRIGLEYRVTRGTLMTDWGLVERKKLNMSLDPSELHAREHGTFLEEVHSFEFWFQSVEGYLRERPEGVTPGVPEPALDDSEREGLIQTLCTYCVGETAALEGASGMIGFAPNRHAKIFLATQVVDEARHLEVFLHRLRDLGVSDPDSAVPKGANQSLITFKRRLLEFVDARDWEASVFAQNVILESMEFATFHNHKMRSDPKTAEILEGVIKDERRHMGFGENDLGRRIASTPQIRDRLKIVKRELDSMVLDTFEESLEALGVPRGERPDLGRSYLDTVARLGFDQ